MQIKNQKSGFTFIELIATITLIGLVLLIITPGIKDITSKGKRKSFLATSQGVKNAVYTKCIEMKTEGNIKDETITIENFKIKDGINFDFDGELPEKGLILIDKNCKIQLAISNNFYCARKKFLDEEIEIIENKNINCLNGYEN